MSSTDIRELDRLAVQASVAVVSRTTAATIDHPTPCADWTVRELITHMAVQHYGFAAAAAGAGADPAAWEPRPWGDDLVSAYAVAADRVLDAFAAADVLDRAFVLPEVSTERTFPGRQAISFHFVDYVVHGWDIARALDVPLDLEPEVLDAALGLALAVPDGPRRLEPGAAFRPGVPTQDGGSALDRIVAALGRSPTWPD